jgi:N-acetyl-anhydromuramyl-L-alanine amidase AmpD
MGSRGRQIWAALAAFTTAAVCVTAAQAKGLDVLWLASGNHTSTTRKITKVDRIVVHVTQGSFWGAVTWLRNPRAHGSSHYVVSKGGHVVQLVSTSDVAWHAGSRRMNRRSIGIEHEGFVARGGFTEKQYRASAQLVAYLAMRAGMPIDREHVIGHNEVPDPSGRGVGGADGHTDPGPKWDWERYMGYVREYAENPVKPTYTRRVPTVAPLAGATPVPKRVAVAPGAVVKGVAPWSVRREGRLWGKGVYRVEFSVDGKLLWRDRVGPFAFGRGRGWDTRSVPNGRHLLTAKVYGRGGYRMTKRYPVRVNNKPVELALTGVAPEAGLRGDVTVGVTPSYPVQRVVLYVDGKAVSRDSSAPYELTWDSTVAEEGPHELLVYARTAGGRRAAKMVPVVVANEELPPTLGVALSVADTVALP